ncbi:Hypothetical protein I595_3579 [Croceitalea dokdonensis DOKDO 023]|uniref:Lipoprotein n=1 Tax=Croceitalea dokdonensis DOKDO 023 TaxID=1300341 RepID=A0A0P7AV95_9FLAO|nr:hypothetical protein [Croceitalea dokdonensis]KPM30283.1 Hypothetical protein I595_3579 [Croceitalea dokdonensis DOKDO 023]
MKRKHSIFLLFYVFATVLSCADDGWSGWDDCNCTGEVVTISFNDLELQALEQIETAVQPSPIVDTIAKQDLLLRLHLPYQQTESVAKASTNISGLGFSSAYACSCVFYANIANKIIDIQVFQQIAGSEDYQDVTSAFGLVDFRDFNANLLTVEEALEATRLLEENLSFINTYEFKISSDNAILNTTNFRIVVTFEDQTTMVRQTSEINFLES